MDRVVETGGDVDLDATLAALREDLEFYQRELHDMHAFQREHNADWSDVSDNRAEFNEKSAELRTAIQLIEAIKVKASS
ncbi:MAG TPA: hypothetical protein VIV58_21180 [Kofleriaceae bacterium]